MDEVYRLARAAHTAMLAMSSTGDWHSDAGDFERIAKELGDALAKPQLRRDCVISWGGNNVFGDRDSITEVKSLVEFEAARKGPDARDEEIEELQAQGDRQAQLLSRIAVALRGPEPPLTRWSWHDLPERALELKSSNIDPKQLSRILHETAGAVSMCWDPRPAGEFDSAKACEFVAAAIAEIRSRTSQPEQQAPAWWALVMGAAASIEDAENCLRDPDAKRQAEGAAKHYREAAKKLWAAQPEQHSWSGDPSTQDYSSTVEQADLERSCKEGWRHAAELEEERQRLTAQLEEFRRDAERYRLWRAHHVGGTSEKFDTLMHKIDYAWTLNDIDQIFDEGLNANK